MLSFYLECIESDLKGIAHHEDMLMYAKKVGDKVLIADYKAGLKQYRERLAKDQLEYIREYKEEGKRRIEK